MTKTNSRRSRTPWLADPEWIAGFSPPVFMETAAAYAWDAGAFNDPEWRARMRRLRALRREAHRHFRAGPPPEWQARWSAEVGSVLGWLRDRRREGALERLVAWMPTARPGEFRRLFAEAQRRLARAA